MHLLLTVLFSILLLKIAHVQSFSCLCSCCLGSGCQPATIATNVTVAECTNNACLAACRTRYYQCTAQPPNGQATGICIDTTTTTTTFSPMTGGPYSCKCDCCNTGSYTCTPGFVGYSNAYSCQIGACSIACANQYPYVCVNNYLGQTQGTCLGLVNSTPPIPSGSSRCGCSCQAANGYQYYEMITSNGCSSCNVACRSVSFQCSNHQHTYCI